MVFHSPRPPGKGGGIDATSGQGNHVSIAPHGKSIPTNGGSNPPSPTLAEAEDPPRCEHPEWLHYRGESVVMWFHVNPRARKRTWHRGTAELEPCPGPKREAGGVE